MKGWEACVSGTSRNWLIFKVILLAAAFSASV